MRKAASTTAETTCKDSDWGYQCKQINGAFLTLLGVLNTVRSGGSFLSVGTNANADSSQVLPFNVKESVSVFTLIVCAISSLQSRKPNFRYQVLF